MPRNLPRRITTIRLSEEDRAYAEAVRSRLGLSRMADAIRLAIHELAEDKLPADEFQRISETRP